MCNIRVRTVTVDKKKEAINKNYSDSHLLTSNLNPWHRP